MWRHELKYRKKNQYEDMQKAREKHEKELRNDSNMPVLNSDMLNKIVHD
jgi:hypothetical protein